MAHSKTSNSTSNAYVVSYVDFNGKMITRTYDRHHNPEKK